MMLFSYFYMETPPLTKNSLLGYLLGKSARVGIFASAVVFTYAFHDQIDRTYRFVFPIEYKVAPGVYAHPENLKIVVRDTPNGVIPELCDSVAGTAHPILSDGLLKTSTMLEGVEKRVAGMTSVDAKLTLESSVRLLSTVFASHRVEVSDYASAGNN